jgi:hypothetical protein
LASIGWSGVMVFALPLLLLLVPAIFRTAMTRPEPMS